MVNPRSASIEITRTGRGVWSLETSAGARDVSNAVIDRNDHRRPSPWQILRRLLPAFLPPIAAVSTVAGGHSNLGPAAKYLLRIILQHLRIDPVRSIGRCQLRLGIEIRRHRSLRRALEWRQSLQRPSTRFVRSPRYSRAARAGSAAARFVPAACSPAEIPLPRAQIVCLVLSSWISKRVCQPSCPPARLRGSALQLRVPH